MDILDELEHLLLIVEHGTFTAAAKRAHLSQPALSASVRRLEEWAGARLLHRGRHGASLTAAGSALVPRARAAIAALEDGRRAIAEVEGLHTGEVRIGAGATVTTYLLPRPLAKFRRSRPGVHIVLRELPPAAVRDGVEDGSLDFGVASSGGGDLWRRDEFVLVGAPGTRGTDGPFVTFAEGTQTRATLDRYFPDANIVMELGSISAAKSHVREGIGIALMSRTAVERDLASGRLIELRHPRTPIPRRLVLVHRGVDRLPPAAAKLREMLLKDRAKGRGARRRAQ